MGRLLGPIPRNGVDSVPGFANRAFGGRFASDTLCRWPLEVVCGALGWGERCLMHRACEPQGRPRRRDACLQKAGVGMVTRRCHGASVASLCHFHSTGSTSSQHFAHGFASVFRGDLQGLGVCDIEPNLRPCKGVVGSRNRSACGRRRSSSPVLRLRALARHGARVGMQRGRKI